MNDTWGFRKDDDHWKSPTVLIQQLATATSRGGNYLLNVGPTSEGVIPPPSVERLAEVGKWTKANGESIYATSASPFPYTLPWGVITTKLGRIYLHVFSAPEVSLKLGFGKSSSTEVHGVFGRGKELTVYGLLSKVQRAYLLSNHAALKVTQSTGSEHEYT